MSFFRHLRAAWNYARRMPLYVVEADAPDFWTEDDAKEAEHFFTHGPGAKLQMRLTNYEIRAALMTVKTNANHQYNCGWAAGVAALAAAITSHFPQAGGEQPASETSGEEALPDALEAFRA